MKTARQFADAGVEFLYDEGSLCCVSPDECKDDLVAEVRRRVSLVALKLPKEGAIPIIKIAEFEEKRWGACMTCGDQIASFAGGMCPLCILALRKALQESGRFDPKPVVTKAPAVAPLLPTAAVLLPVATASLPGATKPKISLHKCHALGCKVNVPERYLMCGPHWKMVSSELQARVWDTYVEGQEIRKDPTPEYLHAQIAAVRWVAKKEGRLEAELPVNDAQTPSDPPVDEYVVYVEAFSGKNRSAYCVLITRGENKFDVSALLPGNSSIDEAYCEGFTQALELVSEKQAPVAICVAPSLWNLAIEMPAWSKESAYSTKARSTWNRVKSERKQHATRIFPSSEGVGAVIMRAKQLAYLEVNPDGIWAPQEIYVGAQ